MGASEAAGTAGTKEPGAVPGGLGGAVQRVVAANAGFAGIAWVVVAVAWILVAATAWVCWWELLPRLWAWVGAEQETVQWLLRMVGALFASIILLAVPFWGGMASWAATEAVFSATVGDEPEALRRVRQQARETEEDALRRLEKTDDAGLRPLLRYSRAQLDAYYAMGLGQTRRAFVNAALAMWLGFLILIAGIVLSIGPVEQFNIARPDGDFASLVLASALIIEVISALFLWVYRSTIGQLTFYYRLQMQSHTAIMCFRIAETMADGDAGKSAVIEKLLGATPDPERPAPIRTGIFKPI